MRNYMLYLEDYIHEAMNMMRLYKGEPLTEKELYESEIFEEETDKDSVYIVNYYLQDHLQKTLVGPKLKLADTKEKLIEFTGRFIDEHAPQLSTAGPVYSFTFGDKETSFLYKLFETDAKYMLELYDNVIQETYHGKISAFITGWIKNAPHKILLTCILVDAIQNDYQDIITCCEYLWAFAEYPIIYREYWRTGVKPDVMNYTMEHLGNKFKYNVKKMKNLQDLLKYDGTSSVLSQYDRLKTGADHTYFDFMRRMRNQINNTIKNIAREYYKNSELNATQHTDTTVFDDGTIADQDGMSTNVAQIIDNTCNKFALKEINASFVNIAAEGSKVDKNNLSGYIAQIYATKNNRMNTMIEDIITSYFNKNPANSSLSSGEFVNFGLVLYRSIGNSKDTIYQEIRQILNQWMYDIINIKEVYSREPTQIAYTRAIFNYIILMIGHYN